jgi:hypothetical protein
VAVNVTDCPAQIAPDGFALMLTDGVTEEFTVIVIALDVAVVGLAQEALEVITQVITSPSTRELVVYIDPAPTLVPFFFH